MPSYKRNQVEEAIARTVGESGKEPSVELRTQLKRLLEADRALGRNPRSSDPQVANFAFFSSEAPGRGVEVLFSAYEAFALLTALRLLQHNWPQSFPVTVLRQVRPELEREHARILKQDPAVLFDEKLIRAKASPGSIAVGTTDPVFLIIISRRLSAKKGTPEAPVFAICRGEKEMFMYVRREDAASWTSHELVAPAHLFAAELKRAEPRKRGRPG